MNFIVPYDQIGITPPGAWANAAPSSGVEGSIPNADFFPAVQNEILNTQDEAGLTRNANDFTQLLQAIRSGKLTFFADTGSADALVVTPRTAYTALSAGMPIQILKGPGANATTTPTLNVNGLVRQIVKEDGTAVAVGDLPGSILFSVINDGNQFRVVGLRKSDASVSNSQFINLLTQNIAAAAPQVLNDQVTVSSFTPVVVLSDLPYNVYTVVKSLAIPAGKTYVNAYGQLAYRNDNTSLRTSFTTKLTLFDNTANAGVDAQYIGGAIGPAPSGQAGTQISQPTSHQFFSLNPAHSYTLQLVGFKIDNNSPLVVLDGFIQATVA